MCWIAPSAHIQYFNIWETFFLKDTYSKEKEKYFNSGIIMVKTFFIYALMQYLK